MHTHSIKLAYVCLQVSKGMNHLLKSPFCVHPATRRLCVPVDPAKAAEFRFDQVPTLQDLLDEYSKSGGMCVCVCVCACVCVRVCVCMCFASSFYLYLLLLLTDLSSPPVASPKMKAYVDLFEKLFLLPLEKERKKEPTLEF